MYLKIMKKRTSILIEKTNVRPPDPLCGGTETAVDSSDADRQTLRPNGLLSYPRYLVPTLGCSQESNPGDNLLVCIV